MTSQQLSREARFLRMYRAQSDTWAHHKLGFEGARYRRQSELEDFLQEHPEHNYARKALQDGRLELDPDRSYQEEALRMMSEPGFYCLRWPNAAGKTAVLAILILWFLDCYPDGAVVSTAGTWSQIRDQLWREIPYWYKQADTSDLTIQEVNKTSINVDDKWFAMGRASSSEETFEGIHSPNVLVIFDEGKAIPQEVYDAGRRILRSGENNRLWWVVASTPGSPSGGFYDICCSNRWKEFHLTAYETARVSLKQIQADLEELTENGPLFYSMDLAEFPVEGDDTILPLSQVLAAVETTDSALEAREKCKECPPFIGVDVARYGSNESGLAVSKGGWTRELETWRGQATTYTSGRIIHKLTQWGMNPGQVAVDDVGVGGAVVDLLSEQGWRPQPIDNGTEAHRSDRYANAITEMWFAYQALMRKGLCSIPDDRQLVNQLSARRYEFTSKSRLRVEPKRKLRSKGEPSPDRAEIILYSTWPAAFEILYEAAGGGQDRITLPDQEGVLPL